MQFGPSVLRVTYAHDVPRQNIIAILIRQNRIESGAEEAISQHKSFTRVDRQPGDDDDVEVRAKKKEMEGREASRNAQGINKKYKKRNEKCTCFAYFALIKVY